MNNAIDKIKSGFFLALIVLLMLLSANNSSARSEFRGAQETQESLMAIEVTGDRISGHVKQVPLKVVLNKLAQEKRFKYQIIDSLSNYRVSAQFDNVSVSNAIKILLEPFNYVLATNGKGDIETLSITDKKQEGNLPVSGKPSFAGSASDKHLPAVTNTRPLPTFTPVTNDTGPASDRGARSANLPEFKPVQNKTGPQVDKEQAQKSKPFPTFIPSLDRGALQTERR